MKINFRKLRNKELAALAHRVIKGSKEGKYTMVENHELLLELEKQYANYYKSYGNPTFSGKGGEVFKADVARFRIFRKIRAFLRGYKGMTIMPNFADAEALYGVFQATGLSSNTLSYAERTALMKKLIEELEKTENAEKIISLNLTEVFDEFKTAQKQFEDLYAEQAEANAQLRTLPSATAIRGKLEGSLRNYFSLLKAMKDVPDWKMIYAEINELVKRA